LLSEANILQDLLPSSSIHLLHKKYTMLCKCKTRLQGKYVRMGFYNLSSEHHKKIE